MISGREEKSESLKGFEHRTSAVAYRLRRDKSNVQHRTSKGRDLKVDRALLRMGDAGPGVAKDGTGSGEQSDRGLWKPGPSVTEAGSMGRGRWDREMGISGPWVAEAGGVGCGIWDRGLWKPGPWVVEGGSGSIERRTSSVERRTSKREETGVSEAGGRRTEAGGVGRDRRARRLFASGVR